MRSIQLINAPLAKNFRPSIRAGAYPPLHLACLATYLRKHCQHVDLEIVDGELCDSEDIISRLDSKLIAISCNSLTYEPALLIAEAAKQKGAFVVLGGVHPTFVGRNILHNRAFVDAVVYGEGELALTELVNGAKYSYVPNLIYRNGRRIIVNKACKLRLNDLPFPDYEGISLEPYFQNYQKLYYDKPFKRAFAAYSAKGCQWRRQSGGCIFCAIQHNDFRIKSVKKFWRELEQIQNIWGADFVWDVSDTFSMQRAWIRCFANEKPPGIDLQFQVYARASDIDEEMARLLSCIGVYEVFVGLDSGSNKILKTSRKGTTVSANLEAIKNLNREGIKAVISVVIGLPGENEETLMATRFMIEDILSWGELSEINCSILLPLPGSHIMTLLNQFVAPTKGREDLFDADVLRRAWVDHYCHVSYETLIEEQKRIMKLHDRVGTFGVTMMEQTSCVANEF